MAAIDRYRAQEIRVSAVNNESTEERKGNSHGESRIEHVAPPVVAGTFLKKIGRKMLISILKFLGGILFLLLFIAIYNYFAGTT